MIIGAMNHPTQDPIAEIRWMAESGLEFIDLTLEPPAAATWRIDTTAIRNALESASMRVVGHTAYYLPIGHAFDDVRSAATAQLVKCLQAFAEIGAKWMNVHPDGYAPMHSREFVVGQNIESLETLLEAGQKLGVGVMVENVPAGFNTPEQLGELLEPLPELGLHLDIGHANLRVPHNTSEAICRRYGNRLRHLHLHDNNGESDQHLPLGAGSIDIPSIIRTIKRCGYDGSITLEVFSHDKQYFQYSRDVLRKLWDLEE